MSSLLLDGDLACPKDPFICTQRQVASCFLQVNCDLTIRSSGFTSSLWQPWERSPRLFQEQVWRGCSRSMQTHPPPSIPAANLCALPLSRPQKQASIIPEDFSRPSPLEFRRSGFGEEMGRASERLRLRGHNRSATTLGSSAQKQTSMLFFLPSQPQTNVCSFIPVLQWG